MKLTLSLLAASSLLPLLAEAAPSRNCKYPDDYVTPGRPCYGQLANSEELKAEDSAASSAAGAVAPGTSEPSPRD